MSGTWRFLKPTTYKSLFLLGWALYSLGAVLRAYSVPAAIGVNLIWPAVFLYLLGCATVRAGRSAAGRPGLTELAAVAVVLAALDHAAKIAVLSLIPVGASIPVVPGHLHLVQVTNRTGSWLFAAFGSDPVVVPVLVLSVLAVLSAPLLYRYYSAMYRRSFWSDVAFTCLMASSLSGAVDLGLRGGVVDYLLIPGHFSADLKDIVSEVFLATTLIEILDNPGISKRWTGWRKEWRDLRNWIVGISRFAVDELRRIRT